MFMDESDNDADDGDDAVSNAADSNKLFKKGTGCPCCSPVG